VKILFDANTPAPLARFLRGHEVVLSSNHWPTLRRIAARIATAVDFVQIGQIVRVDVAML
jgi:hypothetical protein